MKVSIIQSDGTSPVLDFAQRARKGRVPTSLIDSQILVDAENIATDHQTSRTLKSIGYIVYFLFWLCTITGIALLKSDSWSDWWLVSCLCAGVGLILLVTFCVLGYFAFKFNKVDESKVLKIEEALKHTVHLEKCLDVLVVEMANGDLDFSKELILTHVGAQLREDGQLADDYKAGVDTSILGLQARDRLNDGYDMLVYFGIIERSQESYARFLPRKKS